MELKLVRYRLAARQIDIGWLIRNGRRKLECHVQLCVAFGTGLDRFTDIRNFWTITVSGLEPFFLLWILLDLQRAALGILSLGSSDPRSFQWILGQHERACPRLARVGG